jgi:hypothetical protein
MCSIERKLLSTGLERPVKARGTACWVAEEAIWAVNPALIVTNEPVSPAITITSPTMSSGTRHTCCPISIYDEPNAKLCALRDLRGLVK